MNNFRRLEVVGRGSKSQLQVDENLKKITGKGLVLCERHWRRANIYQTCTIMF